MTVIERASNAEAAGGMRRSIKRVRVAQGELGSGSPQSGVDDAQNQTTWFRDPESARRLSGVVAVAREQSAGVIGITGPRPGVGVSVASRQLAEAFSEFGIKTLFVNVSRMEIVDPALSGKKEASFLPLAAKIKPSLSVVEFDAASPPSLTESELRSALAEAVQAGFTVVLDLPPILQDSGMPTPVIAALGSVCDVAFLVCLSGAINQKEMGTCIETCRIIGLKLDGLILNDWRMPASGLISG